MALSGLDIFKLLPKTNCGDCGVPTCMAFAMKLAQKKAELSECPHASEAAKATLGAASEPPIRLVKIGGANALEVGGETVLFRHEKTFFHQTGIALEIKASDGLETNLEKIREIGSLTVERVGEELSADLFFVTCDSDDKEAFLALVKAVKENSNKGLILQCPKEAILKEALEIVKNDRPAILLNEAPSESMLGLAKSLEASLILTSSSFEDLEAQTTMAKTAGVNNLILNLKSGNTGTALQNNSILRRSALK